MTSELPFRSRPARTMHTRLAAAMGCVMALVAFAACGAGESSGSAAADVGGDAGRGADTASERGTEGDEEREPYETPFRRFEGATVTDMSYGGAGLDRWQAEVPGIADVRIPSSIDAYEQPALWLAHDRDQPRPLLVVLHSWSVDYQQHLGIPYAKWAGDNGWAMIHPDFRGVLASEEATGSDRTVQDILDAVDFADAHADIDTDRVFITGFSGGGMMALTMAGRHPERFAGVVSWVPIYDLVEWHGFQPGAAYARQIEASCGGNPQRDEGAAAECLHRSPSAHLDAAREAEVPIYIGHGLDDYIVPVVHAVWAFNHLAAAGDRFDDQAVASLAAGQIPDDLQGEIGAESFFREPDPPVRFTRRSGNVTLVLFEGGHEGVFNPGLEWMVDQIESEDE